MLSRHLPNSLQLRPGQTQSLVLNQAREITVKQGRAWITITGVSDDYWLQAGDQMLLPAHMQVVIEADRQPCELSWQTLHAVADTAAEAQDARASGWLKQVLTRWHFA